MHAGGIERHRGISCVYGCRRGQPPTERMTGEHDTVAPPGLGTLRDIQRQLVLLGIQANALSDIDGQVVFPALGK